MNLRILLMKLAAKVLVRQVVKTHGYNSVVMPGKRVLPLTLWLWDEGGGDLKIEIENISLRWKHECSMKLRRA